MSSMKVGIRLGLAFGLVLLITLLLVGIGMIRLSALKNASHEFATAQVEQSTLAHQWEANININWVRAVASIRTSDAEYTESLQRDMDATTKSVTEIQKKLETLTSDESGKALMANIGQKRESYRTARAELLKKKKAGEDVSSLVERDLHPVAEAYLASLAAFSKHTEVNRPGFHGGPLG